MKKTNIISNSVLCRVRQLILLVCFLMSSYAYATISIEVPDNVIQYGNTDINILCTVNGSSLVSIEVIQLKRSSKSIVSITQNGIVWQDTILMNRSEINATIENVDLSYLHLKIVACNVKLTDEATYYCDLSAIKKDFSGYLRSSEQIPLNITGFVDGKTDKCGTQYLDGNLGFGKGQQIFSSSFEHSLYHQKRKERQLK